MSTAGSEVVELVAVCGAVEGVGAEDPVEATDVVGGAAPPPVQAAKTTIPTHTATASQPCCRRIPLPFRTPPRSPPPADRESRD
jgi:hypothetical protein